MDDFGGPSTRKPIRSRLKLGGRSKSKRIQLNVKQRTSIEQELKKRFLEAMRKQVDTLNDRQEVKFMSDVPVSTKQQIWKDVYQSVVQDILPRTPESQYAALEKQFSKCKKELMKEVNTRKTVSFAAPEEDLLELFGANGEVAEESDEEQAGQLISSIVNDIPVKVIKEPSFFEQAREVMGNAGRLVQSLLVRSTSDQSESVSFKELESILPGKAAQELNARGSSGKKVPYLKPGELSQIREELTKAFFEEIQYYDREEIKSISDIPEHVKEIWDNVYHQVLNNSKPMTLGDKSDREALASQFNDLKQELMHNVNRGTVADEGMRASSAGVRLESRAPSEKHVQGLSRLGSDKEVVSAPKKVTFFDKLQGGVKAFFARRKTEEPEESEEPELSEENNREQPEPVDHLGSSEGEAGILTLMKEANLRAELEQIFLKKIDTDFSGAQNITKAQKDRVWQEVYSSVLNHLEISLTANQHAALEVKLMHFKAALMTRGATPKKKVRFAPKPHFAPEQQVEKSGNESEDERCDRRSDEEGSEADYLSAYETAKDEASESATQPSNSGLLRVSSGNTQPSFTDTIRIRDAIATTFENKINKIQSSDMEEQETAWKESYTLVFTQWWPSSTPQQREDFAKKFIAVKEQRMKKVNDSHPQSEQFREHSDAVGSDYAVESESDEEDAEPVSSQTESSSWWQRFSSLFGGSEKPGLQSEQDSAINKLEGQVNPNKKPVETKVESQVIPADPGRGPVTLLSSRPGTPQTAELFRISLKTPGVSPRRIISQPMPTPQAALDQMAIYQEYFENDSCRTRGCEGDVTRLTITINKNNEGYDPNNEKQYYIQPSADPQHPGVDFIADLQADGTPDMALILKICADAADVAIEEYQKQYGLEIHGERPPPKVNFDIPENVPEHIRNAMKSMFYTKYQECPGAFLVDSVIPGKSSVTVRTPKPGGSSSDAEG